MQNTTDNFPEQLEGYKLIQLIDRGAFGAVCLYAKGSEKVAIKFES